MAAGTYSVTARAVENTGASTTSTAISVIVTSGSAAPGVAITGPPHGSVYTTPVNIPISANAAASSGRFITQVQFYYGGSQLIGTDTSFPYSATWTNAPVGTHLLTARATDNLGATGTSPSITVTTNAGAAPVVSITGPPDGSNYQAPASIPITATATASPGRTISRVDFYAGTTLINTDTTAPYSYTWSNVAAGTYSLTAKATDNTNVSTTSTAVTVSVTPPSPPPAGDNFSSARLDPINRTGGPGEDLFSRNFNWGLPILSLPGRAGLDLGLGLAYNSLVWTRDGSQIKFNTDNGFPGPGFRLGFPVIQQRYLNSQVGVFAYLMITPSGGRVELRQVGSSTTYESADSSYIQLIDNGSGNLLVRTPDGSQLSYTLVNQEHRCTQIKDRNGNYITVTYNSVGRITTVIDTLARAVNFDYDAFGQLTAIWQLWNGGRRNWATFGYGTLTFQTNFPGLFVIGPQNGQGFPVLTQVSLADGSRFNFSYNTWGQVYVVTNFAPNGQALNHVRYDLPLNASVAQTDCPRFTIRGNFIAKWNGDVEAATQFIFAANNSMGQFTAPDGTVYKEFFSTSGVQRGLTTQSEVWSGGVRKKWTVITWVQDSGVSYRQNPRIIETNVFDEAGNRRRSTITYNTFMLPSGKPCSLPADSYEYAANGLTVLRRSHTDYNLSSSYVASNRRIIGLPTFQYLYGGSIGPLMSKVQYLYDDASLLQATPSTPLQHDQTAYGSGFVLGRGNLARARRYDVTFGTYVETQVAVNTTGSPVFTRDPLNHQTTINYGDSFSSTGTPIPGVTLAYPTTVTDADGFSSTSQYDYDLGAVRRIQDSKGAVSTMVYDTVGRISRTDVSNGAYTRFTYPNAFSTAQTLVSRTLIQTGSPELFSEQVFDGAGRVIATTSDFPGSTGGYRGQSMGYDIMGRMSRRSNPTEMTNQWLSAGDDAQTGWLFSNQTYDWRGRPRIATNTDQTTSEMTYGGCGCAGGEVVTVRDEMNRRQRMTYDVLGRLAKTEILNWNQSVYSTTKPTYNARDQVTLERQYQGTDASTTSQDTVMTYDGHARLSTRKLPVESSPTSFQYHADDLLHVRTEPRGATETFNYNARHLATNITYAKPGNAPEPDPSFPNAPAVAFGYDSSGNRLWMTDGQGRVDYGYNTWSRLTSETRFLQELGSSFALTYQYNLAGGLTRVTEPFGSAVNYVYDSAGQLTSATGSGPVSAPVYIAQMGYRAWGAPKQVNYGNGKNLSLAYNTRLAGYKFQHTGFDGRDVGILR